MHRHSKVPYPTLNEIKLILNNSIFPKPSEQINNFIPWLGDNSRYFGEIIPYHFQEVQAKIGVLNDNSMVQIADSLDKTDPKILKKVNNKCQLTINGWQRYEELKSVVKDSRNAFMAMKFGNSDLEDFYKDQIKPAVKDTGFDLNKPDEKPKAGIIDVRMEVEIRNSRFVIADLTHKNNGVYWEAGFASGLGIPVIYTCQEDEADKLHFDTNHRLFVKWNSRKPEEAKEQLKAAIRATLPTEAKMADEED